MAESKRIVILPPEGSSNSISREDFALSKSLLKGKGPVKVQLSHGKWFVLAPKGQFGLHLLGALDGLLAELRKRRTVVFGWADEQTYSVSIKIATVSVDFMVLEKPRLVVKARG